MAAALRAISSAAMTASLLSADAVLVETWQLGVPASQQQAAEAWVSEALAGR